MTTLSQPEPVSPSVTTLTKAVSARGIGAQLRHIRYVLADNPVTAGSFILFVIFLLAALIGPSLVPYDPLASNTASALRPPSAQHWFGTDQLGRDIFSRVVEIGRAHV